MKTDKITIGTRGSKLALWQAEFVKSELQRLNPGLDIELNKIKTTGDKILDVPLSNVGGKGLFVKEIEEALLRSEADIAVHSMKDVPTEFPDGLHLAVICEREDPRDAFIAQMRSHRGELPPDSGGFTEKNAATKFKIQTFNELPLGAKIGTSSLRRSSQLLHVRPDLKIEQLRGNLDTRLRKLDEGRFDAIILAAAGVKRLGWENRITEVLPFNVSLPATGQGAIGIECRTNDEFINRLIEPLNHAETSICVGAERAFLRRLAGGCQVPIAAHARIVVKDIPLHTSLGKGGNRAGVRSKLRNSNSVILIMDGLVGSISGERMIRGHIEGKPEDAEKLGFVLAEDVLSKGAKEILDEVYDRCAPQINGEIGS